MILDSDFVNYSNYYTFLKENDFFDNKIIYKHFIDDEDVEYLKEKIKNFLYLSNIKYENLNFQMIGDIFYKKLDKIIR